MLKIKKKKSHPTLGGKEYYPGCLAPGFYFPCGTCAVGLGAREACCRPGKSSQAVTAGLFLLQCTDADGPAVDRARAWCEMTDVPYFR